MPASGCEVCASTGDCSRAFRGGPGQFCGTWVDGSNRPLPCCCPLNAVCRISPPTYECTCTYTGVLPPYHSDSDLLASVLWLWWILGVLAVIAACLGCGYVAFRLSRLNGRRLYAPVLTSAPLVSPARENLYGSTGQSHATAVAPAAVKTDGSGQLEQGLVAEVGEPGEVAVATHDAPPDDLGVAGDGFDGGLGDVERAAKKAESGAEGTR